MSLSEMIQKAKDGGVGNNNNLQIASQVNNLVQDEETRNLLAETGGRDFRVNNDMIFRIIPINYGDIIESANVMQLQPLGTANRDHHRFAVSVRFVFSRLGNAKPDFMLTQLDKGSDQIDEQFNEIQIQDMA